MESNDSFQFIHELKRAVKNVGGGARGCLGVNRRVFMGEKRASAYLGHIRCSPVPFLGDILKNQQFGKVSQKLVMVVLMG